jgi:hypothetical protein
MNKILPESFLPLYREISFRKIRKCSSSADLCTKGLTVTEVAGHRPFGNGMKRWSAIRTGIDTGLAADTSFFIGHYRPSFRGALPGTGRTDIHARGLFALLTEGRHEDSDLFPLLHPYPRKGRTTRALMREAADHFTRLASSAAFRDNGDGAHFDNLLASFFIMN